jgi:lipoyl(octanoyl) transferase
VSYPILNLNKFPWLPTGLASNSCYVHALEQVVIDTLDDDFDIKGERSPDTGVWLGNSKICAMGLQVKKGFTMHGIALNCNTDLNWFGNIVPCGLVGKSVTTLSEELGKSVTVEDAIPGYLESFSRNFKCTVRNDDSIFENVLAELQN